MKKPFQKLLLFISAATVCAPKLVGAAAPAVTDSTITFEKDSGDAHITTICGAYETENEVKFGNYAEMIIKKSGSTKRLVDLGMNAFVSIDNQEEYSTSTVIVAYSPSEEYVYQCGLLADGSLTNCTITGTTENTKTWFAVKMVSDFVCSGNIQANPTAYKGLGLDVFADGVTTREMRGNLIDYLATGGIPIRTATPGGGRPSPTTPPVDCR